MRWLFGGLALAAFFGVACVGGDDKSDAATQGSLGGPCFANNTCNTGLVCVLVNGKGVCQESDATVQDAPADQTATDSGGDATQDVAADVAPVDGGCDSGLTAQSVCFGNCQNQLCCQTSGQCYQSGCGANCGQSCWSCSHGADCPPRYMAPEQWTNASTVKRECSAARPTSRSRAVRPRQTSPLQHTRRARTAAPTDSSCARRAPTARPRRRSASRRTRRAASPSM